MLFGRSDFINEIDLDYLLSLELTTIGINCQEFKTDIIAFLDKPMTHYAFDDIVIKLTRNYFKGKIKEPVIYYEAPNWNFTHDMVLWWLKEQGVKNVVLIGCADFIDNVHYNSNLKFNPSENNINSSINFIENFKYLNIYTLNPNSKLNIPRILIKDIKKLW